MAGGRGGGQRATRLGQAASLLADALHHRPRCGKRGGYQRHNAEHDTVAVVSARCTVPFWAMAEHTEPRSTCSWVRSLIHLLRPPARNGAHGPPSMSRAVADISCSRGADGQMHMHVQYFFAQSLSLELSRWSTHDILDETGERVELLALIMSCFKPCTGPDTASGRARSRRCAASVGGRDLLMLLVPLRRQGR